MAVGSILAGLLLSCDTNLPQILHRTELHMGTRVTLTVVAPRSKGDELLQAGFAEVARMEALFSSYRTDSVLAQVNRGAGAAPVAVPPEFIQLTQMARSLIRTTGGAFNPLVGPAIKAWGIPEQPQIPDPQVLAHMVVLTRPEGLLVDPQAATVALTLPGMALGLGGIAKGFTADRVAHLLQQRGVTAGMVAMAGDVRVWGRRPDGGPWRLGVRDPSGNRPPLVRLALTAGAVSTSGNYERYFERDGVRYHHILDPRTLRPSRGLTSVTVWIDGSDMPATTADGLATGLFVMGLQAGRTLVASLPNTEALWVDDAGQVTRSDGWPEPG